ncbi:transposase [Streptomyces sp. NPDC005813]|uniref:transposase n=1 Tax=Streptomyces sp. NPDC005813 TaxID=3155592 RepID=UPI0033DD34E2
MHGTGIPWRTCRPTSPPTCTGSSQGTDAGKRIIGRKRHLGCDTLGLLPTVLVTVASGSDIAAGVALLSRIVTRHRRVTKACMDAGYVTTAIDHGARLGIDVHVVQSPPRAKGFTVIPRWWTIERSIGWLTLFRRVARDYETHRDRTRIHASDAQSGVGSQRPSCGDLERDLQGLLGLERSHELPVVLRETPHALLDRGSNPGASQQLPLPQSFSQILSGRSHSVRAGHRDRR